MNNPSQVIRPEIRRVIDDIQILPELLPLWQADFDQLEDQLRPLQLALVALRQTAASQIAPTLANQKHGKKPLPRSTSDCRLVLSELEELSLPKLVLAQRWLSATAEFLDSCRLGPRAANAPLVREVIQADIDELTERLTPDSSLLRFAGMTEFIHKRLREAQDFLTHWEAGSLTRIDRLYLARLLDTHLGNLDGFDLAAATDQTGWKEAYDRRVAKKNQVVESVDRRHDLVSEMIDTQLFAEASSRGLRVLADYLAKLIAQLPALQKIETDLGQIERDRREEIARIQQVTVELTQQELTFDELGELAKLAETRPHWTEMVRQFVNHPDRLEERYWLNYWLVYLFDELGVGLAQLGLGPTERESLLDRVITAPRMSEVKILFARYGVNQETLRRRCLWLRSLDQQMAEADRRQSSDSRGILPWLLEVIPTPSLTAWLEVAIDPERLAYFSGALAAQFNEWFRMSLLTPLKFQPERVRSHVEQIRQARLVEEQATAEVSIEPSGRIAHLTGLLYFPRLNPEAKTEDETARVVHVLKHRPFEITSCFLPVSKKISLTDWQKSVPGHIGRIFDKLQLARLGDPERIGQQLYERITSTTRAQAAYADGSFSFQPAGSHDYSIVFRILVIPDIGPCLVWRYAKTAEEQRR